MSKKGENIFKRKDGRYEARYVKERNEFGRIIKYGFVYGKNYTEVKLKREKIIKNNLIINKDNNYIDKEIINWLKTKVLIKESSYYNYYSIIYSKIIPFFKNYKINNLNENLILEYIKYLKNQNLSNKRIKDILIVLKQFFKYKNINIKINMPKIIKKKIITLKDEEIKIIENNAIKSNNIKDFAILLVLFSGLRIGELCALTWKDINFDKKIINVNKTIVRIKDDNKSKLIITSPKSITSNREIPIHNFLIKYLSKFKKEDSLYLLTGTNKFITTQKYYKYYKSFLKNNNINDYNFHILRHTFATRCLLNGMDVKTLSEILGHSNIKITLDIYIHIKDKEKLEQINKLPILSL